ncbi:unnamed protein product [Pleuronectes platessa]|uniref:Phospholipase A2 n=1 Tax=Pleuronectes platessa TaxID=8262 RepID=A0A9N7V0F3_PLEPL|nr:unnamed protein product [Pleuronectes platessa]
MNFLRTLFLLAAGLSVVLYNQISHPSSLLWSKAIIQRIAINQFRKGLHCLMSDSSQIKDYADYGCYCGYGGSGTPVDELDRCCQVHDRCFDTAMQQEACWSLFDSPHTRIYSYDCEEANKTITCGKTNNGCEMLICECDRKAAECFAKLPHNDDYKNLTRDRCQ